MTIQFRSVRGLTGRPMQSTWYALIVPPQTERRAAGLLTNAGVEVIYPTLTRVRHRNGKKYETEHPMISQLIFGRFEFQPHWDVMKDRRVISGVVSRGNIPAALNPDDVSNVMGLPTEAERLELARLEAIRPVVGGRARILAEGLFKGHCVDVTAIVNGRCLFDLVSEGFKAAFKGDMPLDQLVRVAE